jgi:hypothetical protein
MVVSATIAYRQMRVTLRGTTLPILTASIESRETPDGLVACVFLNNSASTAPALDVRVEASFTPRSTDRQPDKTEVVHASVVLPGSRLELALPPALSASGFTVEEFILSYSRVTVQVAYRVRGLWRSRRMRQSMSTITTMGMTPTNAVRGTGDV